MKMKRWILLLTVLCCIGLALAASGAPAEDDSAKLPAGETAEEEKATEDALPEEGTEEEELPEAGTEGEVLPGTEETPDTPEDPQETEQGSVSPSGLPEYQPGSLQLYSTPDDEFRFERPYRYAYYVIWGEFGDLLDEEQLQDFFVWSEQEHVRTNYGRDRDEMYLVSFVKRYNISREDFDRAVDKFIANNRDSSCFMTHEVCEVPNADIIYTFDNEIINYYYRYE